MRKENVSENTNKSTCRFCSSPLDHPMLDLGMSPLCQNRIYKHELNHMEPFYPLRVYCCATCYLVQLEEYVAPNRIFSDYAYFSSYSESWLRHAADYVDMIVDRLALDDQSKVVELASNDGYLLRNFVNRGVPCLGIEPADNVAKAAISAGVPTIARFFGKLVAEEVSNEFGKANLIIGNNVLAHVPDLNDFVAGIKILLDAEGVVTMEFPHLLRLMDGNQFDTIYHEHFSYLSLIVVREVFKSHGMTVFDVEELKSHGGSLRIYACHSSDATKGISSNVIELDALERARGIAGGKIYDDFAARVRSTKREILSFLIRVKSEGKSVVGYGAPGKGNTLLNYCGIREDFLDYTVDVSPHKQGTFTPGTHIPIYSPEVLSSTKPNFVLILPWNLEKEIVSRNSYVREWGGKFVVPIPTVRVIE